MKLSETDRTIGIQLFRERLWEKMFTRQSRKIIWDIINTLIHDTSNYRPITVLPVAGKIYEKLLSKQITNFMDPILSDN